MQEILRGREFARLDVAPRNRRRGPERAPHDRYEVVRRKVLEAGGTPGFWEQAQNATRFFSVRPRAADGTVAVAALRQATFDEAESLCVLASRARKLPEGGVNLS